MAVNMWPTPVSSDTGTRSKPYAQGGTPLSMAVNMWPTPTTQSNVQIRGEGAAAGKAKRGTTLAGAVNRWPMPTCHDAKNNGGPSQQDRNSPPLNSVVGGPLNPPWVEWLMGWPIGWTALEALETDRFQQWRRLHGEP
jgi:hypothetical protein